MPTIRKLAEIAGVSIGTVSMALHDDPRVSVKQRKRIQELASLYNYRPNRLTQGLVNGKTATIGLLMPSVTHEFSSRILSGVLQQAYSLSYQVITLETHANNSHIKLALEALTEQRVEGVLVMTGTDIPLPLTSLLMLQSHNIHSVLIDITTSKVALDSIRSDENQMAMLAVNYLYELGHRSIGLIGRKGQRHLALTQSLRQYHLPADGISILLGEGFSLLDDTQADDLFLRCWNNEVRNTAYIAFDDYIAGYILRSAPQHSVSIPEDLSVLGYGNSRLSSFLTPRLTTIEQYPETIGAQACAHLLDLINENSDPETSIPTTITIPAKLVNRFSCAALTT